MKNEQSNNQSGKQDQNARNPGSHNQLNTNQPQDDNQSQGGKTAGSNQDALQTSNISVGNDGKIGKAHDQWNSNDKNDNQNGNSQQYDRNQRNNDQTQKNNNQPNTQSKADRAVAEPEMDAPMQDPDKSEKKISQTNGNNDKR